MLNETEFEMFKEMIGTGIIDTAEKSEFLKVALEVIPEDVSSKLFDSVALLIEQIESDKGLNNGEKIMMAYFMNVLAKVLFNKLYESANQSYLNSILAKVSKNCDRDCTNCTRYLGEIINDRC